MSPFLYFQLCCAIGETPIRNYLILTGGLGNQLFQVAAASHFTGKGSLVIDTSLSSRRSGPGETELEKLYLAENISFSQIAGGCFFSRKVFNMFIRISASKNIFFKSYPFQKILLSIGSRYFSYVYKDKIKIFLDGNDFKLYSNEDNCGRLFIGYFQNHRYCENTNIFGKHGLISKEVSTEVEDIFRSKMNKAILVIHIRLGDYQNESSFGIPSPSYYEEAIAEITNAAAIDECWIFSNDIETAKKYINNFQEMSLKWYSSVGTNDVHLLMTMSQGDHFIIGNSTFSWWAANLAVNPAKIVVAPKPWFRDLPEPNGLIAATWLRKDAKF